MNREAVEHVSRASAAIIKDTSFVVRIRVDALEPQRAAIATVRAWAQRRIQETQAA